MSMNISGNLQANLSNNNKLDLEVSGQPFKFHKIDMEELNKAIEKNSLPTSEETENSGSGLNIETELGRQAREIMEQKSRERGCFESQEDYMKRTCPELWEQMQNSKEHVSQPSEETENSSSGLNIETELGRQAREIMEQKARERGCFESQEDYIKRTSPELWEQMQNMKEHVSQPSEDVNQTQGIGTFVGNSLG